MDALSDNRMRMRPFGFPFVAVPGVWPWWKWAGAFVGLAALAMRAFAPEVLQWLDDAWAWRGDTLAAALLLSACLIGMRGRARQSVAPDAAIQHGLKDALAPHFDLDDAFSARLQEVMNETESSSLAIIGQVRQLYDRAGDLVRYMETTNAQAGDMEREVLASVTYLLQLGTFVQDLPAKLQRDVRHIESIAGEIRSLAALAERIQTISMQSHLLAINAAIEASRAGQAGQAFKVVAEEVRLLAANSSAAAVEINAGLLRARTVLESGLEESVTESSDRFDEIAHASLAISNLQTSFKDITEYYRSHFGAITQNNVDLAGSVSEVLGQVQTQDVVRQRIERLQAAMASRNLVLAAHLTADQSVDRPALHQALGQVHRDYVAAEIRHAGMTNAAVEDDLKIELF
jgi:methyl-accepting chemotaxis protein